MRSGLIVTIAAQCIAIQTSRYAPRSYVALIRPPKSWGHMKQNHGAWWLDLVVKLREEWRTWDSHKELAGSCFIFGLVGWPCLWHLQVQQRGSILHYGLVGWPCLWHLQLQMMGFIVDLWLHQVGHIHDIYGWFHGYLWVSEVNCVYYTIKYNRFLLWTQMGEV